jgi:hypothetical protein
MDFDQKQQEEFSASKTQLPSLSAYAPAPEDVHLRDAYEPSRSKALPPHDIADKHIHFPIQHSRGRPEPFKPDGSFRVLKETGKLGDAEAERSSWWADDDDGTRKRTFIPGYTGHIRGKRQVSGRTAGATANRCLNVDLREIACTSPIPSSPQYNRKISQQTPPDTFITNTFHGKVYHVPGYSGHVPGARQSYAQTFGTVTSDEVLKFRATPEGYRGEAPDRDFGKDGYAKPIHPRQYLTLNSEPLPGGVRTVKPPELLVPGHLRYLRYLAQ